MEETTTQYRDYRGVTTEQIVEEMLKENTGTHFLDSGGAYGRNWQRNQTRDFESEPAVKASWSVWRRDGERFGRPELCATVSLYHWMTTMLELDVELQEQFERFVAEEASSDASWLQLQEEFADKLEEMGLLEGKPYVVNTYNDPDHCDLSQVLQYVTLQMDGDYDIGHLIVSVHGGCDVRGGYGTPKVFKLRREYYEALDGMQVRNLGLSGGDGYWFGDGSYFDKSEPSERNEEESDDLDCDILKLPCTRIEWVAQECPAVADMQVAIDRVEADQKALELTTLTAEQVAAARVQMLQGRQQMEREQREAALDWLYETLQGPGLLADHGELYIVYMKDEAIVYDTVEAYANFN